MILIPPPMPTLSFVQFPTTVLFVIVVGPRAQIPESGSAIQGLDSR